MSEEELNEQYIRNKIGGICQDCMWLDKTIPIIRKMLSKAYINGLEQSRFDKKMLEIENKRLKKVIEEVRECIKSNITYVKNDDGADEPILDGYNIRDLLQILDKTKVEDERLN